MGPVQCLNKTGEIFKGSFCNLECCFSELLQHGKCIEFRLTKYAIKVVISHVAFSILKVGVIIGLEYWSSGSDGGNDTGGTCRSTHRYYWNMSASQPLHSTNTDVYWHLKKKR